MKNLKGFLLIIFFLPQIGFTQFSWEHLSGPPGSAYSRIFSNDNYAFIPEGDFLYRSADGISWEKINHKVSDFMCVYGDTIVNILTEAANLSLQHSFDQGENWLSGNLPSGLSPTGGLVMCSHGVYISNDHDSIIYKSNDLGINWDSIMTPETFTHLSVFDDTIFISSDTMLWRFNEIDESWSAITPPLSEYVPNYKMIDDFVVVDSHIIVYAFDFLFHSHDYGMHWDSIEAFASNPYDQLALTEDAIYFNGFGSILRSYDYGHHWDTIVTEFYPQPAHLNGLRNILLGSTYDSGVFRWEDTAGLTFENNQGLEHGRIINLAYGAGKIWAACGNGIFAYDISAATWTDKMQLPPSPLEYQIISANDEGWVVAADDYSGDFFFSDNQGISWDTISPDFDFVNVQLEGDLIFAFYSRLYRSADKGQHWDTLDFPIRGNELLTFQGKKYVLGHGKMFYSNDNGMTWESYTISVPDPYSLYAFENNMYLVSSDLSSDPVLYVSPDGFVWTKADEGLPEIEYFNLWYYHHPLFFRDATAHYAFLSNDGHFISTDFSSPWMDMEASLTGNDYLIIDNTIYLGSEGLYKSVIENPYITAVGDIYKNAHDLFTIAPNPADDFIQVTITDVEVDGALQFSLYDSKGDHLKSQTSNNAENIRFDIQGLPSGIYLLQARTSEGTGVVKVMKN